MRLTRHGRVQGEENALEKSNNSKGLGQHFQAQLLCQHDRPHGHCHGCNKRSLNVNVEFHSFIPFSPSLVHLSNPLHLFTYSGCNSMHPEFFWLKSWADDTHSFVYLVINNCSEMYSIELHRILLCRIIFYRIVLYSIVSYHIAFRQSVVF